MAKELPSNQWDPTHAALETLISRVPEVTLVFDPLSVCADQLKAFEAFLGVQSVVALHTVRVTFTCNIQEPAKIQITLVTTEVLTVPVAVLGLSVLPTKDQLQQRKIDVGLHCAVCKLSDYSKSPLTRIPCQLELILSFLGQNWLAFNPISSNSR